MPMYRVRTVFTGVAGSPAYNNLYFGSTVGFDAASVVEAVTAFWADLLEWSDDACIATVEGDVAEIDEATGDILAVETVNQGLTGGQNTGTPLPPATQGLLRLRTGAYEGSRQVQGRIFIPYLTTGAGTSVPGGTQMAAWSTAGVTLRAAVIDAGAEWVVWSRTNGLSRTINSISAWGQYAVQRSRRD